MPAFLEAKLKKQYPGDDSAVYGTLNKIGAMHGNKETAKGRAMEAKHKAHMLAPHAEPDADDAPGYSGAGDNDADDKVKKKFAGIGKK